MKLKCGLFLLHHPSFAQITDHLQSKYKEPTDRVEKLFNMDHRFLQTNKHNKN